MEMERLNLIINEKAKNLLENLVQETGKNKSQIVREALILRDFFHQEMKQGKKIGILSKNKELEKEIILI